MMKMMFGTDESKKAAAEEVLGKHYPQMCERISKKLPENSKYLLGDKLTCYDIEVCVFFSCMVLNTANPGAPMWAKAWEATPDNIKAYVANFQAELKDYIDARPACPF